MKFKATSSPNQTYSLSDALLRCLTPAGDTLMPECIPVIPLAFFNNMREMTLKEIAYVVLNTFFGQDLGAASVKQIVDEAITFDMPLVKIDQSTYVLEMHHGTTLTYKDLSARLLSSIMTRLNTDSRPLNILTSTTGNTGAAIAQAFRRTPGARVHVLFPRGSMTTLEQAMITSAGDSVIPIEVLGTVDDCRRMVHEAFHDRDIIDRIRLTTANSINVGRLLTQTVAFFQIYARLMQAGENPQQTLISVPGGNLGNLTAAVVAHRTGLPLGRLLAVCNANNYFDRFMRGETPMTIRPVKRTLSRAMDSSKPSNIERLRALYNGTDKRISDEISSITVNDITTAETINEVYYRTGYMLDPHGAVAYSGLHQTLKPGQKGVVLATAHPAKSLDVMTQITGRTVELPLQLTRFMTGRRASVLLPPTYPALKKYLLNNQ